MGTGMVVEEEETKDAAAGPASSDEGVSAPGFGVSQEAHLMSPGPFLTRQASHFHSPGFLNLDMSNPVVVVTGAAEATEAPLAEAAVTPPLGSVVTKHATRRAQYGIYAREKTSI